MEDHLLKVTEVAKRLGLAKQTIYAWILTRKISSVKIGRCVRIKESEIGRIIEDGEQVRI